MSVLVVIVAIAVLGEIAGADEPRGGFRGDYQFNEQRICTDSSGGFGPNLEILPIPLGGFLRRSALANDGVVHFNPDGTGTSTNRNRFENLTLGAGGPSFAMTETDNVCQFTYQLLPGGKVVSQSTCSGTQFGPAGDLISTTLAENIVSTSQLTQDGRMQLRGNGDFPTVETVTVTPIVGVPVTFFRICTRNGVGVRIDADGN